MAKRTTKDSKSPPRGRTRRPRNPSGVSAQAVDDGPPGDPESEHDPEDYEDEDLESSAAEHDPDDDLDPEEDPEEEDDPPDSAEDEDDGDDPEDPEDEDDGDDGGDGGDGDLEPGEVGLNPDDPMEQELDPKPKVLPVPQGPNSRAAGEEPKLPRVPRARPKPGEFFRYWGSIPLELRYRVVVYVYRLYPVIDRERTGGKVKYIDKLDGNEVVDYENYVDEFLKRYGVGDYHLKLNDGGAASKTMCTTNVETPRSWDDYPPLLDFDEVVEDDPKNRSFVERLKARGEWGRHTQQKEIGMEASTSNQLIGMLKDVMRDQRGGGNTSALEMLVATQGVSQKMIADAAAQAREMVKAEAGGKDPVTQFDQVIKLAEKITARDAPAVAASTPNDAMMERVFKMQMANSDKVENLLMMQLKGYQDEMRAMRTEMATMRDAKANPAQGGPKDLAGMLQEFATLKDVMGDLMGGQQGFDWSTVVPLGVKALDALSGMTHNMAVARTGHGSPVAVNVPAGTPLPGGQAAPAQPVVGAPAQPPQAQPGQPGAGQPPAGDSVNVQAAMQMLETIKGPVMEHITREDKDGVDFADWFILTMGREAYDGVRAAGKQQILMLFSMDSELTQQLSGMPGSLDQLLDEFLEHDSLRETEQQLEAEAEEAQGVQEAVDGELDSGADDTAQSDTAQSTEVESGPVVEITSTPSTSA